jgi:hypothetical protein
MSALLVTVCTNRKTIPPIERLKAQDLPSGPQSYVSATWRDWLREANPSVAARHIYAGRGFVEATLAAERCKADLWIVSAGLGLVHGEDEVPAYDLTLFAGSESSVRQKVTDGLFDAPRWWSDIGRRKRPKRSLLNPWRAFNAMRSSGHVKGIVEYLDHGDVLFPNAIILAFSPEVTFTQTRG